MDPKILELRIQKWIPLIQEQANSGLNKKEWCSLHGIERTSFFRWQKRVRSYLLEQQSLGGTELPVLKQDRDDENFVELPTTQVTLLPVLKQDRDDENFVELPTTQVTLAGAYHTQNNYPSGGSDYPSIQIHYGGFSINLSGMVDERQLSSVLRVVRHAD